MRGLRAVRVTVSGRVQGVGYRAWTEQEARALGLAGWVRNRRDGTVEAVFEGPSDAVERMVARCRVGPPAARVDTVDEVDAPPGSGAGFTVRPSM